MTATRKNDKQIEDKGDENGIDKNGPLSDIIECMSHTIAVLTVVYENYTVVPDFLRSFKNQTSANFHLFIADASQKKQTIETEGLPVTIIPIENKGYSYGINCCIKGAVQKGYTFYCVINNDTFIQNDFIQQLTKSFDENSDALIGGKIYYAPEYEYHKDRYTRQEIGHVLWYAGGSIDWNNVYILHRGVDEVDHGQYNKKGKTDFITGCMMAFNKSVADRIGLWDESYFLYYEDADFCQRAIKAGLHLIYDPSLILWHKNAQSTEGAGSLLHQHYQETNRLKFGLTYAPWRTKIHLILNFILGKIKSLKRT